MLAPADADDNAVVAAIATDVEARDYVVRHHHRHARKNDDDGGDDDDDVG